MSELVLQSVLAQQRHVDCTLIIRPLFFVVKQIKGVFKKFLRIFSYVTVYAHAGKTLLLLLILLIFFGFGSDFDFLKHGMRERRIYILGYGRHYGR